MYSTRIVSIPNWAWRFAQIFISLLLLGIALLPIAALASEPISPDTPNSALHFSPTAMGGNELGTSAVGDPLPRIQCTAGSTATIYTQGLSSPDGLAFGSDGKLYVAEEGAGRVSRIETNGITTTVVSGLNNPEGVAFDDIGTLYVVEDIKGGRVVTRATNGVTGTLIGDLDAPEGVVWFADGSPNGILYVTESTIEHALSISSTNPISYQTYVTAISLSGTVTKTRLLTTTANLLSIFPVVQVVIWGYAGITVGPNDLLYFTNELSGQIINETFMGIPFNISSTDSVFTTTRTPPATPTSFAPNSLIIPEGLRFSVGGKFPLYVVEENIGGGAGRLSRVEANGSHTPFCTGFGSIEDVAIDGDGQLYVSEDSTGFVIAISPPSNVLWFPIILKNV